MKYEVAKRNAQQFANERNQPVYIARADKLKKFEILFDKEDVTPNYRIWETVIPALNKNLEEERNYARNSNR